MPGYGCGKKKLTKALENPLKPAGSVLNRAEEGKKYGVVARALSLKRDKKKIWRGNKFINSRAQISKNTSPDRLACCPVSLSFIYYFI